MALALVRGLSEHRVPGEPEERSSALDGCDRDQGGAGQRQVRPVR